LPTAIALGINGKGGDCPIYKDKRPNTNAALGTQRTSRQGTKTLEKIFFKLKVQLGRKVQKGKKEKRYKAPSLLTPR